MCTLYPILEKWALLLPNHQYLKKMLPFGLLHSIVFMVAGWSSTQQISFFTWDENLLIILIISLCQRHQCTPKHALFNLIRIYSLIHTHKWNVKPQSFGIFWQNVYFWSPFEQLLLSLPETENKPYCESWWGVKWQSPCGWNLDFERIFLPPRLFAHMYACDMLVSIPWRPGWRGARRRGWGRRPCCSRRGRCWPRRGRRRARGRWRGSPPAASSPRAASGRPELSHIQSIPIQRLQGFCPYVSWVACRVKFCSCTQKNQRRDGNLVKVEWELTVHE